MPQARPAFELLRFTAAPVADALALVDVEGRFAATGRFARRPALVVEPADGEPLELSPVHVDAEADRWSATYVVPLLALVDARFALAARGRLVELPAPDRLDAAAGPGESSVRLAREANALRRALERAEAQATQAEDHAQAAEQRAADAEERAAAATERVGVLERAVRELEQRILGAEGEAEDAQWRAEDAQQALTQAGDRASEAERRAAEAEARAEELQQRAVDAEARAGEAREEAADAEARVAEAQRRAAAADDGLGVLRAELAEERERAERLAQELESASSSPAPLGAAAPMDGHEEDDDAEDDEDVTRVHPARDGVADARQATPPGGIVPRRPILERRPVVERRPSPRRVRHTAGPERWLAVIAVWLAVAIVIALVLGLHQ